MQNSGVDCDDGSDWSERRIDSLDANSRDSLFRKALRPLQSKRRESQQQHCHFQPESISRRAARSPQPARPRQSPRQQLSHLTASRWFPPSQILRRERGRSLQCYPEGFSFGLSAYKIHPCRCSASWNRARLVGHSNIDHERCSEELPIIGDIVSVSPISDGYGA